MSSIVMMLKSEANHTEDRKTGKFETNQREFSRHVTGTSTDIGGNLIQQSDSHVRSKSTECSICSSIRRLQGGCRLNSEVTTNDRG